MSQTTKEMRLEAARLLQSISEKERTAMDARRLAAALRDGQVIKDEAGREWTKGMLLVTAQMMEEEIAPIKAQARELQEKSFVVR